MKFKFIASAFVVSLMGCASNQEARQATESTDQSNAIAIQEESIPGARKPEVIKMKIAQPDTGISPNTLLNGVTDILVDGRLESDSLKKENAIHVFIDDLVEKTGELDNVETGQSKKVQLPK